MSKVMVKTTLCLMLGQHLRLWINMNPALGHRSYLGVQYQSDNTQTQYRFTIGPSFAMQAQH